MNRIEVLLLRISLSAVFGVVLTRCFRPEKGIVYSGAVAVLLLLAAYFFEYLRTRKEKP
jgi:hypothetical protein